MSYAKSTKQNQQKSESDGKIFGVYIKSLLVTNVLLSISEIGKNVKKNLEAKIVSKTEGRCIAEGFIQPNSVRVLSYSSGIVNSEFIEFHTSYECMICHPVEGMLIECDTKTITKAGIHAEVITDGGIVPVTVFVARDHNNTSLHFNSIKENTKIAVKVIGIRYELNDPYICVIGKLTDGRHEHGREKTKPRLTVFEE
jgi:DNA-directed RNA polymerase subunit E'/Rpb7